MTQHHLESVKEFQGGSIANQKVIKNGQAVSTALGTVPRSRKTVWLHGARVGVGTASTVETYMGVKPQATDTMFTNNLVWVSPNSATRNGRQSTNGAAKYLPKGASAAVRCPRILLLTAVAPDTRGALRLRDSPAAADHTADDHGAD